MNKLIVSCAIFLATIINLNAQDDLAKSNTVGSTQKQLKAQIQAERAKSASLTGAEKVASQEALKSLQAQFKALRQSAAKNNSLLKSKSQASLKRAANKNPKDPLANLENSLNALATKVALIDNQIVNDITQVAERNAEVDTKSDKKEAALETAKKAIAADQQATETIAAFENLISDASSK